MYIYIYVKILQNNAKKNYIYIYFPGVCGDENI